MIRHIVFFSAKNPKDSEVIFAGLSLLKENPYCLYIEVGRNFKIDTVSENAVEFIVYGEFSNEEQLENFKKHSSYQASIDVVRPLRELRLAADFFANKADIK